MGRSAQLASKDLMMISHRVPIGLAVRGSSCPETRAIDGQGGIWMELSMAQSTGYSLIDWFFDSFFAQMDAHVLSRTDGGGQFVQTTYTSMIEYAHRNVNLLLFLMNNRNGFTVLL